MAVCIATLFWFQGLYSTSAYWQRKCPMPSPLVIPIRGPAGPLPCSLLLACQKGGRVSFPDLELSFAQGALRDEGSAVRSGAALPHSRDLA